MPWDTDLDVMVSEQSADHLAKYYNSEYNSSVLSTSTNAILSDGPPLQA